MKTKVVKISTCNFKMPITSYSIFIERLSIKSKQNILLLSVDQNKNSTFSEIRKNISLSNTLQKSILHILGSKEDRT